MRTGRFTFLFCIAAGMLTVMAWLGVIFWTANDFWAEGPDTPLSEALSSALLTFGSLVPPGMEKLTTLGFALAIPVSLLAGVYFAIWEGMAFVRGGRKAAGKGI